MDTRKWDTRRVLPTANESRASPRCHELAADVRSLICCSIRYPSTRRGAARRGNDGVRPLRAAGVGRLFRACLAQSRRRFVYGHPQGSARNHSTFEGRVESARCAVPIDTRVFRFLPFAKRRGYVLSRTHAASNEVAALVLVYRNMAIFSV